MTIPNKLLENRAIQCLKDIDFSYFNQQLSSNNSNKFASASFTDLNFNVSFIAKYYEFSYHLYKNNEFKIIYLDKEGQSIDVPIQDDNKFKIITLLEKVRNIILNKDLFNIDYQHQINKNVLHLNSPFIQLYKTKLEKFSLEEFKLFVDKLDLHKADFFSKKHQKMMNVSFDNNCLYINQTPYIPNDHNNKYFLISPFDLKEDLIVKYKNKDYTFDEFNEYTKKKQVNTKIKL